VTISVVNQTQGTATSGITFFVSSPSPSLGDLILALQVTAGTSSPQVAPSGFSSFDSLIFNSAGSILQVFTKTATGAEPGSYTFNNSPGSGSAVIIFDIQNSSTTPDGVTNHATGNTSTPTSGSLNVSPNELTISAVALAVQATMTGNDAGWFFDGATPQVTAASLNFEYRVNAPSPVSGLSWSTGSGTSKPWAVLTLSISPSGGGGSIAVEEEPWVANFQTWW
jgi:hypothetical protein